MKTSGSHETSTNSAGRTNRRAVTGPLRFAAQWMLTLTLLATVASAPASPPRLAAKCDVGTLSANLYIGASTERILALDPTAPGYLTNLLGAVTQVYYEIIASQPAVRLQAVADEIVA